MSTTDRRSLLGLMLKRAAAVAAAAFGARAAAAADTPAKPAPRSIPVPGFINIALNVSDVNRSRKFYVEALGFQDGGTMTPDGTTAKVMGWEGQKVDMKAGSVRLGGVTLFLRQFDTPKYVGNGYLAMNHLGLSNIAVSVADMDKSVELIKQHGGNVDEHTRALRAGVGPLMLFASDPDGARIELLKF